MSTTRNYTSKSKVKAKGTAINDILLVRSGNDYFQTAIELISQARKSIYLLTYIFKKDETGEQIALSLLDAVHRNVQVYVMADAYASSDLPNNFIKLMVKSGIKFRYFNPLLRAGTFYFGRRLHTKVLVVDGEVAMVGGMNIANRYNDTPDSFAWLDYAVKIKGDALRMFEIVVQGF